MEKTIIETSDRRLALLIDADNVSARYLKPILNELSKYGTVTIKRIYGDWTLTLHAKWKDALLENSITPIQQFGYTQGKNATDSAMIIDAMDILYTDNVDGFCLVSSDSDFTRLASRLRESGRMVIGMGEKKTPTPFRRACDVFTTLELLVQKKNERNGGSGNAVPKDSVEQAVVDIITDNQNNGKATGLGEIGSRLQKRYPDFDVRSYGTNLLSKLLEEFTRVRITKDHSSVTVELAEGEEPAERKEERSSEASEDRSPRKSRNRRNGRNDKAEKSAESAGEERTVEVFEQAVPDPAASEEAAEPRETVTEVVVEETAGESTGEPASEPAIDEAPARRVRNHRGTRRVVAKKPARLTEGASMPVGLLKEPAADKAVADKAAAAGEQAAHAGKDAASEASVAAAETVAPAADASSEEPRDVKPGRKARAQRKAAQQEATETAVKSEDSEQPKEAAAKKQASKKQAPKKSATPKKSQSAAPSKKNAASKDEASSSKDAKTSATSSAASTAEKRSAKEPAATAKTTAKKQPAKKAAAGTSKKRATKKAPSPDTPQGYIHQLVADAGSEGILLSTVTDGVRAKFKDFKVRDLGFAQMRQYMASTGQYQLEKSGRNFRVRLA
ncbi:NYN domain-containing protein [Adlercreutzia equolifaciens]|uniref:NYN domain-containing protein n=1 Tax=Adlercreutzia equolifaciens TaxID=446660 RepID=UPI0023B1F366|nr:NYN domain-containing protein [Adlercreutzia equolifaciens]MDE8702947.1 NYN domain-containing protein [Adlercreutzia equolifaciens]